MKALALFAIFVLIFGTTSTSVLGNAYAQDDPSVLLRIAVQADKQILNQLEESYGDLIPEDIQILYDQGHTAVESIESSLPDDIEQAREDFLFAMKSFMQITKMVPESVSETRLTASFDSSDRDPKSVLHRLYKYFQNLKAISEKHETGIDFSEIKRLFVVAHEQIDSGEIEAATQTIQQLESLIHDIKNNIHQDSSHSASDRVKKFVTKQLDKIQKILDEATYIAPDMPELDIANSLVVEIEILILEDNISDAKEKFKELNEIAEIIKNSI